MSPITALLLISLGVIFIVTLSVLNEGMPSFMLPSYFVPISALPLTAHGKIDRDGLPMPDFSERFTTFVQLASN